nr:DarT ssDNA thymidine ADP-ribosyltransferase family protein [Marinicella sp. W31]MDC2880122.1 DarT ssDNA thymidine ADP-ribosyltransferase family protein [Marinicella sp. W31]
MERQAEAERNENPEDDKSTGSLLKINRDRREALSQVDTYDAETKQALTDAFYAEVENQAKSFREMASRLEADQDLLSRFVDLMASTKGGSELFLAVVASIENSKVLESDIIAAQNETLSDTFLRAILEDVNAAPNGAEDKGAITDSPGPPPPGMREEGPAFIEESFSHDQRSPFDIFFESDDRAHNLADSWIGREREDIEETALELDIPFLVHFTRCSNLSSIMKYGLIPVSTGRQSGIRQEVNDHNRWDRHRNATSLSIGFPNYQMFYKYRQLNPDIDWAILLLKPRILWQLGCAFCRHNAADRRIRNSDIGDLKSAATFRAMFNEDDTLSARSVERLERYDPTDPQAEVLVFGAIPPEEITGVVFESDEAAQRHSQAVGKRSGSFLDASPSSLSKVITCLNHAGSLENTENNNGRTTNFYSGD